MIWHVYRIVDGGDLYRLTEEVVEPIQVGGRVYPCLNCSGTVELKPDKNTLCPCGLTKAVYHGIAKDPEQKHEPPGSFYAVPCEENIILSWKVNELISRKHIYALSNPNDVLMPATMHFKPIDWTFLDKETMEQLHELLRQGEAGYK